MGNRQADIDHPESPIDMAWQGLAAGDLNGAFKILAQVTGYAEGQPSYNLPRGIAEFLFHYDYHPLQRIPESTRREFAITTTWGYLLRVFMPPRHWQAADLPLAAILGTSYVLDVDIPALYAQEFGAHGRNVANYVLPVSYEHRPDLFPEWARLSTLSLAARKVFVRAMQGVLLRSGLVYRSSLHEHRSTTSVFDDGLSELAEARLVNLSPSNADLLMISSTKMLKQFALQHNIVCHGPKHHVIASILAQSTPGEVETLLRNLEVSDHYVRPLVTNLPLMTKYIRAEACRLNLMELWTIRTHCFPAAGLPTPKPTVFAYRPLQPWWRLSASPRNVWIGSEMEKQLVQKIWDPQCDQIVQQLAHEYAWYAPLYVGDAVGDYLVPDRLEAFKRACDDNGTQGYWDLLAQFGECRMAEMGVRYREPRVLECLGCGSEFREWSIHVGLAKKVGFRILFCYECYFKAFWDQSRPSASVDRDDMLNCVIELAAALESIPVATFVQNPDLSTASEEKQIAVVKVLLTMPSYGAYVATFGSWLQVLILAGILPDGTQQTMRGVRCVALDGHECLSLAEKAVDDWLSSHSIPHEIEPPYPYHPHLNPSHRMRADWKVANTFIEYAGLMNEPEYEARMQEKRKLAAEFGIPLIVVEPNDILSLDLKLSSLI